MNRALQRVCELARDFYTRKTVSTVQLVLESGIQQEMSELTVKKIEAYLREHSELIYHWLLRSSDKRVSSGWCFKQESGKYVVEYFPQGEHMKFSDEHTACAEFVVREVLALLSIAKSLNK
jgi:hypothetical protein